MNQYINPREKLFGHLDRLNDIQQGKTPMPVNVEIDLSNRCSLGCEWCHFAYTHTRGPLAKKDKTGIPGGDLMDSELILTILGDLDFIGVRSVVWSGGGEPTLHPAFDSIIVYTSELTSLKQGMYTNGCHINEARAEIINKCLDWVYVSLDAADAESYKRRKGVDKFDKVCEGVKLLSAYPDGATVGVGFLLDRENWNSIERMAELGIELGADYVQFRPIITYDHDEPSKLNGNASWMDYTFYTRMQMLKAKYGDRLIADLDRFRMYQNWHGHGYTECPWSLLQAVITPNGKVWACLNKREFEGELLGDLNVDPFGVIWEQHRKAKVDKNCRVMCRGHIPNLTLGEMMKERPHSEFI